MRAARADDDGGKNALIGVIERAAVEDPLCVAPLGGIIEQRGEAARHAHRGRVFQVDGVDRLVLEAGQRLVYRVQYVSVPNDVLEVGGGGSVDHGVDLDRPLGLVAQSKVKAILTLDPVDSRVAVNVSPVRHHVARDRIGKQRRKIGARHPHFAGSACGTQRVTQHVGKDLRRRPIERCVQRRQRQRPPHTSDDLRRLLAFEQPLGRTAIAADIPVLTSSTYGETRPWRRDRKGPDRAQRSALQPDARVPAAVRLAGEIHPGSAVRTVSVRPPCQAQRLTA